MVPAGYSPALVLLSVALAVLASYTALAIAARIVVEREGVGSAWLWVGACITGFGLWGMHFVGLLAFGLPLPWGYGRLATLIALLIAVAFAALALWLMTQPGLARWERALGAVIVGTGIAGMHYTGMEAVRIASGFSWPLVLLSFAAAILAAGLGIWRGARQRAYPERPSLRAWEAGAMGLGFSAMYYSGMASAVHGGGAGTLSLAISADGLAATILGLTVALSLAANKLSASYAQTTARSAELATSLQEARHRLSYLHSHDSVTGAVNRRMFDKRLAAAIDRGRAEGGMLALLVIDVDSFRAINEAYGYPVGDEVLMHAAQRLSLAAGPDDSFARLGGDEFVAVATVERAAYAGHVAGNYLASLRQPFRVLGQEIRLSASVGIAVYPHDGVDPHALMAKAEAAKAHAKNLGRDRYAFFEPTMNAGSDRHLRVIEHLRLAIERGELRLFYQPKVKAATGERIGVEALLRWQSKELGYVPPGEFIPLAEQTNLILPLQAWVLDEACRQVVAWDRQGADIRTVAVNIPALQFQQAGFVDDIAATLKRHGLHPNRLVLEITETTAMKQAAQSVKIMRRLYAMGVGLSIDDFGTGYSSLSYLKRFPARELKIDRGFLVELERDTEDVSIISAILALAHALRLSVVAEGVETEAQRQLLVDLGCDVLQGYLTGRPAPGWAFDPEAPDAPVYGLRTPAPRSP
ncbi:putative bifunctional diguanylate cyclase/phosphodiesterase [Bordetella hinzii]|uniref:putative bifunctional diguanylate cyclase/phosphodiesterase n=1 Tax=Bordetella hinzii TaxID=103855 RepID=UPI00114E0DCF|nr:EAL domain-containing protein [Bordetella hinzii]QDJ34114.1 bifunctional diguanylate cyclase/phosphodiesterase [Bordetella hinzii]QDJ52186.1 bifunctional diguanylate cyclase/phosphodiesterase [Bordetella hinzii]